MPRIFNSLISSTIFLSFCIVTSTANAQEIKVLHNGITLNANLQQVDEQPLQGNVVLFTHGTLAHNGMEIIQTLQELLADEEIPSLALNLSLGLDDRHGMYDCTTPHNHKHTDALDEIEVWRNWLVENGADTVILAGHSRGGNQTAWYANNNADKAKAQILIAPATWSPAIAAKGYKSRYQQELQPLLAKADRSNEEQWLKDTDFIYCENTQVTASSFTSYYKPDPRFDTPTLLKKTSIPSLVIIGSEDNTVSDLNEKMPDVSNDKVQSVTIEGADHYFRDLYADEVIEHITEFLEQL
mgnify:CR=1 FL=1